MPPSPLAVGEKLYCVSYAPFRGAQSPLDLSTKIAPAQIEQDLAQLAKVSDCVRTYSVDFGLDQVPEIAQRYGLKVLLGLWVSGHTDRTQYQISTGVALANRFPDVVRAIIVGNEVLLRGEVSPAMLAETIRGVKSRVKMQVTYADVWEFWLRYRELANVVDFVTIHILPYWEDDPVAARAAADHVDTIRKRVIENFPGKEIVIGEVGWPSAGRMREAALPSPANQARVIADVLERGKRERFRVNVIEAFDQPWKRALEGTVGGHWGLFDDATRQQKFVWGQPVSNHPHWPCRPQAASRWPHWCSRLRSCAAAKHRRTRDRARRVDRDCVECCRRRHAGRMDHRECADRESRHRRVAPQSFHSPRLLSPFRSWARPQWPGGRHRRRSQGSSVRGGIGSRDPVLLTIGLLLMALTVLAVQSALALSFDPRYRDFPFAPLTAAAMPFLLLSFAPRPTGARARVLAETVAGAVLAFCAVLIVWNETLANWQALWFAGALALLAFSLLRARAAPG